MVDVPFTAKPADYEAERHVLGALIVNSPECWRVVARLGLTPAAFYWPSHRALFRAIEALGKQADHLTVYDRLEQTRDLEAVGGMAYLVEIESDVLDDWQAFPDELHANAQRILDIARKRELVFSLERVARAAFNYELTFDKVAGVLVGELRGALSRTGAKRAIP